MSDLKVIGRKAVLEKCNFGKDSLYRLIERGEFPLAVNTIGRCVGWYQHEVDEWLLNLKRVGKVKNQPSM